MIHNLNHSPTARARRYAFALTLAALAAGVLAFSVAAVAQAATATPQATYYGLSWIPYIAPSDLPPISQRPAICIVDTGVAVTPDLPAAGAGSSIVDRIALNDENPLPYSSEWPWNHGTQMATIAVGADNGWGITGVFPQGRVLSVKASTGAGTALNYTQALKTCRTYVDTHDIPLAALSLSLGSDGSELPEVLADEFAQAHNLGFSIVAAAGNSPGSVISPANLPGVFTAAAGIVGGLLCSYAADGPQVDLIGPSCGITDVDPFTGQLYASNNGGSSMATVVTSSLIALLRTFKPTATYSQVEGWVRDGASVVDGRRVLNGVGAMNAAGLSDVLARAQAREADPSTPPATPQPPNNGQTPDQGKKGPAHTLRSPRARVSFSRGSLRVRVTNRPRGAKLVVVRTYKSGEFGRKSIKKSTKQARMTLRTKKRPTQVDVRFVKDRESSPTVRFRSRRTGWIRLKSASHL